MKQDDIQKVLEYRNKHKRCRYCKYRVYPYVPPIVKSHYTVFPECVIKDKSIHPYLFGFNTLAGCFCKMFGVDENRL